MQTQTQNGISNEVVDSIASQKVQHEIWESLTENSHRKTRRNIKWNQNIIPHFVYHVWVDYPFKKDTLFIVESPKDLFDLVTQVSKQCIDKMKDFRTWDNRVHGIEEFCIEDIIIEGYTCHLLIGS